MPWKSASRFCKRSGVAFAAVVVLSACIERELPPLAPPLDQGPLFFGPRDGGVFTYDGGGGRRTGGVGPGDAGVADGGVDPYCLRSAEPMTFAMPVGVIEQDFVIAGLVHRLSREELVIESDGGLHTLSWTLPSQAVPPITAGQFVRLLYRPYEFGTYQSASFTLRDQDGLLLFVGDTGLHRVRITGDDLQVATISVADRGCRLFPIRCGEPRRLDLLLTDSAGGELRVPPGDKATFSYQGRPYEVLNVNMAELAYIECNVVPARYRSYIIQLAPSPQ